MHFSFLDPTTTRTCSSTWGDDGITTAKKQLGYRFSLVKGTFTDTPAARHVSVKLDIRNSGWAAPYNPRKVELIFQGATHSYKVTLPVDPRRWAPGTTTSLALQVRAPAVPGHYRLLLNVSDASPRDLAHQIKEIPASYFSFYPVRQHRHLAACDRLQRSRSVDLALRMVRA